MQLLDALFTTADDSATDTMFSFAAAETADVFDLSAVSMGVFEKALENVAFFYGLKMVVACPG